MTTISFSTASGVSPRRIVNVLPSGTHTSGPPSTTYISLAKLRYSYAIGICLVIAVLWSLEGGPYGTIATKGALQDEDPERIWGSISSSNISELRWQPCYQRFYCALLNMPLDYAVPDSNHATLALIKLPAPKRTANEIKDPILLNPGGPGTSGVDFLRSRGDRIRHTVGDGYDLISFDPRGVARSTPRIRVFTDVSRGATWNFNTQLLPLPNMTADAIARIRARALVYNNLAESTLQGTAQFIGTAAVARDMLSIVRAHGRERLHFWGFSYGTVLGATFATMFPKNVGRMVLDGVVDANNYYAGLWSNNLRDFDAGLRMFYEACVRAGRHGCSLYEPSAELVEARLERILMMLKRTPLVVLPLNRSDSMGYGSVDYPTARQAIFRFMFSPYLDAGRKLHTASELVSALAAAERHEGRPLWLLHQRTQQTFRCDCSGDHDLPLIVSDDPSARAIACGEAELYRDTVEGLEAHYSQMAQDSSYADVWPNRRARCNGWKIRAKEVLKGPLVSVDTSHPLLFVGNVGDPATPHTNAHYMSKIFAGSVVLVQASAGHASLAATSSCTTRVIGEYFRTGHMPEPGTICDIESRMF